MPRAPLLVLVLLCGPLLAGCIRTGADVDQSGPFRDVHGLAVHPTEPGTLFIATHEGLFRGGVGGFSRVGESRDDLMGFAMHPSDPDVMYSSGHAADATNVTPNLGLRRSEDGGVTWTMISMPGKDLHAIAISPVDPLKMWALNREDLYVSSNGGVTFSASMVRMAAVSGLFGHPTQPDTVLVGLGDRAMWSRDGGNTWTKFSDLPTRGLAFSKDGQRILSAEGAGISLSTDGGATWRDAPIEDREPRLNYVAISPSDPMVAWAASLNGAVFHSADGGETWKRVKGPG